MNLEPTILIKHTIELADAYILIERAGFGNRLQVSRGY